MKWVPVFAFLAAAVSVASPAPGLAADGHAHGTARRSAHGSHDLKAQYGGAVAEVQDVVYELVVRPDGVVVYVTDHGKPLATQGGKGSVTLLSGSQKVEVALAPAGTNELRGTADLKTLGAAKAVASVSLPGKKPVTVRFGPK